MPLPDTGSDRSCSVRSAECDVTYVAQTCSVGGRRICMFRKNYITTRATSTVDHVCEASEQCPVGTFMYKQASTSGTAGILISKQVCRSYKNCSAGEYQSIFGNETEERDNVCNPYTTCTVDQYEASPPSDTYDRVCKFLKICPTTDYTWKQATAYNDTECTKITRCESYAFETQSAISSTASDIEGTDTICQNHSTCTVGQVRVFVTSFYYSHI
jgi:hypothetical protein